MRLASEHGVVVLPGVLFGAAGWDVRVSLASLDADQLRAVGEAIVSVAHVRLNVLSVGIASQRSVSADRTDACGDGVRADDDHGDRARR